MKNLKKTLSMVLVIAMMLSILVIGAGAAFTDDEDINYTTAVEVMTGIGAINGFPDGTFKPQDPITRAEAAKMVAYAILTPQVAQMLPKTTSSFSDVASTNWASPFIEYCVSKGIINGVGGGKFDPSGNVTGYQIGKMMLCAAGYGKNNEYVGANWELNAAIDATDKGIFTGSLDADLSDAATREEAALYVFNALTNAKMKRVVFNTTTEAYEYATGNNTIGEQKYGLYIDPVNENGVAGYVWKNILGTALCSVVYTDNVLGTSTSGTAISTLSNSISPLYIATRADAVVYYYNGAEIPAYAANVAYFTGDLFVYGNLVYKVTADITASSNTGFAAVTKTEYAVKGAIVNFISTNFDAKAEKVTIVEKTVDKVTAAVSTKTVAGVLQVNIPGVTSGFVPATTVKGYEDLVKDDVVLTVQLGAVLYIEKAAVSELGAYTSKSAIGVYTVGTAAYTVSGLSGTDDFSGMALGSNYVIYTDDGGYAIAFSTGPAAAANYAIVLDAAAITQIGSAPVYQAQILLPDGTKQIVTTFNDWTTADSGSSLVGKLITYSVHDTFGYMYLSKADAITDGAVTNRMAVINSGGTKIYADTATVFIIKYASTYGPAYDEYKVFTGYVNVPTTADTSIQLFKVGTTSLAKIVYIDGGSLDTTSNIYILSDSYGYGYSAGVAYRTVRALVNGVDTEVKIKDDGTFTSPFAGIGYYPGVTVPGDGYLTESTSCIEESAQTIGMIGTGIMVIGGSAYTYTDETPVYYIDATVIPTTVTETNVSALKVGDDVNFKDNGFGGLVALYIYVS